MLLAGGRSASGRQIILPESVRVLTSRQRVGMYDHTFKHIVDWGLGFIINSAQYGVDTVLYGYGRYASPRTFGHGGRQCCSGFADPEHGLAAAVIFEPSLCEYQAGRVDVELQSERVAGMTLPLVFEAPKRGLPPTHLADDLAAAAIGDAASAILGRVAQPVLARRGPTTGCGVTGLIIVGERRIT